MRAMLARTCTACVLCFALGTFAARAAAQDVRDYLTAERRLELHSIEDQASLSTGLYVAGGILTIGGMTTLLVGSVGSVLCAPPDDCSPAEITIGMGALSTGIGLVLLLVATFVEQGANERRRRLLRDAMIVSLDPTRSVSRQGAMIWLGARF